MNVKGTATEIRIQYLNENFHRLRINLDESIFVQKDLCNKKN